MHNDGSIYRFIVTADHGFIYKRSHVEEVDKIENPSRNEKDRVERRFILSEEEYEIIGTKNYSLGDSLGNDDTRNICVPITSSIFKKAGGGTKLRSWRVIYSRNASPCSRNYGSQR